MPSALTAAIKRALPAGALDRIRRARWQARHLSHRARYRATGGSVPNVGIGTFDGRRVAYRMRSVDTEVLGHSFNRDIFFAAIPEFALPENGVVMDVGAHIGTFSLLAAEKAPRGRVFAVEASLETFDLLRLNVELSGHRNIVTQHAAMSDRDGIVELHHDPDGNYGHSITKDLHGTSETVAATTLAGFLDQHALQHVDLIKFNCEGAEFPILLSTPREVLRRIGRMVILYHCDLVNQPADALLAHLQLCGFDTRVANQTAERGWIIASRH